jgi:hypothetical protein
LRTVSDRRPELVQTTYRNEDKRGKKTMKTYLCGRPNACCPTVELLPDGTVEIEDDDGDTVHMTKAQYEILRTTKVDGL